MTESEGRTKVLSAKVSEATYDYFSRMANDLHTDMSELIRGILVSIQLSAPTKEDITQKYGIRGSETI